MVKREYDDTVGRDDDIRRCSKTVDRVRPRLYSPAVAGHHRIDPIVVEITIEDLAPPPRPRDSKAHRGVRSDVLLRTHPGVLVVPPQTARETALMPRRGRFPRQISDSEYFDCSVRSVKQVTFYTGVVLAVDAGAPPCRRRAVIDSLAAAPQ